MARPKTQLVERFRTRTIWLHWTMAAAALVLALTGLFLYFPGWGGVAEDGYTRLIHRIFAVIFVLAPVVYFLFNPKAALGFVKRALTWGREDLGWVKAAPDYYFGGDPGKMPPQEEVNTGQKLWMLIALGCGVLFVITGLIMWFFKGMVPQGVFQWCVFIHDLAFIAAGAMFLVHFTLSALHPAMPESMRSMWTGKVSVKYAKSHYGKWYERISKGKGS